MSRDPLRVEGFDAPVRDARILRGAEGERAVVESLLTRIRDEAEAQGERRGRDQALEALAGTLSAAQENFDARRDELLEHLSRDAVELALKITSQLLRTQIPAGAYDLEQIVRDTLKAASPERRRCVIHVHPEDAKALADVPFRSGTEIQADVSIGRGDVHVETPMGLVVREIDALVEAVGERLREELR